VNTRPLPFTDTPVSAVALNPSMTTNQENPNMTLNDQLAPLATRLAQILDDKATLESEERDIKARIRGLVPGPDSYTAGSYTITVTPNRRFDPKTAERILPQELLDLCRVAKVDAAAAREVLPPALYQQCMTSVGDDRVGFAR